MAVIEIKETEFADKIKNSNNKVLIDCYASWCGPCKLLSPILDDVANEVDNCDFYKINIDEANEIVNKYNIMSIPTILIFENNELVTRTMGLKTKEEIKGLIRN